MPLLKKLKNDKNYKGIKGIMDIEKSDDKPIIEKILGDISKTSATKQLVLGTTSGWVTGYIFMKVGKVVAVAVGGGIILLHVAKENDLIKINWNKVNKRLDKVVDKVEEKITGEGPSFMDKMERYVDRKIDKAQDTLKQQKGKARKWYEDINGESRFKFRESHIFLTSFIAGICIGIATA